MNPLTPPGIGTGPVANTQQKRQLPAFGAPAGETPAPAPQEPTDGATISKTTNSGVKFTVSPQVKDGQQLVAVTATLPAAPLLGGSVVVETLRDAQGQLVESKAFREADPETELPMQADQKGTVYVSAGPGFPTLFMDDNPESKEFMKYGLMAGYGPTQDGGTGIAQQEYVKADGSREIIQNDVTNAQGVRTFTQVDISPEGQMHAYSAVSKNGAGPAEGAPKDASHMDMFSADTWKTNMAYYGGQREYKETALKPNVTPDGKLVLTDDPSADNIKLSGHRSREPVDVNMAKSFLPKISGLWKKEAKTVTVIDPLSSQLARASGQSPAPPTPAAPPQQPPQARQLPNF